MIENNSSFRIIVNFYSYKCRLKTVVGFSKYIDNLNDCHGGLAECPMTSQAEDHGFKQGTLWI